MGGWSIFLLAIVGFIPASDVAVAAVNRAITEQIGASTLPGLELRGGVPPDLATVVVVPMLLTTPSAIEEQIEKLEVHHLSNPDANLRFALLSDWKDSDAERSIDDDKLLDVAVAGIARLNDRYGPTLENQFFSSFIVGAYGTTAKESGWAGSASAASYTSSIDCFAETPIRRLSRSMVVCLGFPPASAMS
jgi:hypothetical protein